MKRSTKIGLIVLFLLLAIAFAAITTNLIVGGTAKIGASLPFDVHFNSATPTTGGSAVLSNNDHTITYTSNVLQSVGEQAILDFTVLNNSSQYDANTTVTYNAVDLVNGKDYSEYYSVNRIGFDISSPTLIPAKELRTGRIVITLNKPVLDDVNITFEINLAVDAVERTEVGETITYGDEYEMALFGLINNYRKEHNLYEYEWSETLYTSAKIRAEDIKTTYSNNRPDGTPFYLLDEDHIYAETLANSTYETLDNAFQNWVSNPVTEEIILADDLEACAVGFYYDGEDIYFAAEYGV